jgi:glyoxylase-like metal-dependent hydrolase (beta-lactamase superfamily II)
MSTLSKSPRPVLEDWDHLWAFSPNRDTLGGTAYLILDQNEGRPANILIDCPAWTPEHQQYLEQQGGVRWLVITHRGGMGKVKDIQAALGCQVVVQEQEAYLQPEVEVQSFHHDLTLSDRTQVIWTPGHSPGSSCVYHSDPGLLFTGRHLLPDRQGQPIPLRTAKTFHWPRQLRSIQALRDRFTPETLSYLCPGANTGFLRGQRAIAQAYTALQQLDLDQARHQPVLL